MVSVRSVAVAVAVATSDSCVAMLKSALAAVTPCIVNRAAFASW